MPPTKPISHRERLETTLAGQIPDRIPIALWRHFPVADQDPHLLAKVILDFQEQFDFDLIKVTPASSYCLIDWGVRDAWKGNPEGTRDYTDRAVHDPEDWTRLKPLDPMRGFLGQSLEAVRLILAGRNPGTPVLQTIFNPLSQAKNLAGQDLLLRHLQTHPEFVQQGLKTITESVCLYIQELNRLGVDGIFYAVQHAQSQILSADEFAKFSTPYDQEILAETREMWLNMLHIHGQNILFDSVCGYPFQIINWHDRETSINLTKGIDQISGMACGGLSRDETMLLGTPDAVAAEIRDGFEQTNGKRWIIGTGCVMMTTTPIVNIWAAIETSKQLVR